MEVGSTWLKKHYRLDGLDLSRKSYIASNNKTIVGKNGEVEQYYGAKYKPADETPVAHWEFALKYDDVNLSFFKEVLGHIGKVEISRYIERSPSGKYSRITGFWYEFLFSDSLNIPSVSGNYVDLLDGSNYITATIRKNSRWRVNNNLLGDVEFCPIVRKSDELNALLSFDLNASFEDLKADFSAETLTRAVSWLYTKETRSSFEIEHEKPSPKRAERFIALLRQAGSDFSPAYLDEQTLVMWQHIIVDPRFAAEGFRNFQNYVGQSLPNFLERIHYICPPPQFVDSLMHGLKLSEQLTSGVNTLVRATVLSFGLVFIHPFEDGNGRLHRFLIHDLLVRDKLIDNGFILPVSAHILANIQEYDATLEQFSKQVMKLVQYDKNDKGEITVTNPAKVETLYRYPDLTHQTLFLARAIHATLVKELPDELIFIQRYDELKLELQEIVDMPDKDLDLMIRFLHQNKGVFPNRRRKQFEKLTDAEIQQMENSYRAIFL